MLKSFRYEQLMRWYFTGEPVKRSVFITLSTMVFCITSMDVYGQTVVDEHAPQASAQGDDTSTSQDSTTTQTTPASVDSTHKTPTDSGRYQLEQYRSSELYFKHSFWRGLKLYRAGKLIEPGPFGAAYRDVFAESPVALDLVSKYRTMKITGGVLYTIGMILLITDIVLIATRSSSVISEDTQGNRSSKPLLWGLFVPGIALSFSGIFIQVGAIGYLTDAVEQYNADLASQIGSKPAPLSMRPAPGISVRGSF